MNIISILNLLSKVNATKIGSKEAQALLKDENKNAIPDFLEKGLAPEDLGINLGKKRTEEEIQKSREGAKRVAKNMESSGIQKIAKNAGIPNAAEPVENDSGRIILLIVGIILIVGLYFVFR